MDEIQAQQPIQKKNRWRQKRIQRKNLVDVREDTEKDIEEQKAEIDRAQAQDEAFQITIEEAVDTEYEETEAEVDSKKSAVIKEESKEEA